MELAELLWKTLEIFRDHGGAKGVSLDTTGRVCLVGAVHEAASILGLHGEVLPAEQMLGVMANEMFPKPYSTKSFYGCWVCPSQFNDEATTTEAMVDSVIEKSAIKATELVSSMDDREPRNGL